MIDEKLEKALRRGFLRQGMDSDVQERIFREVQRILIAEGLLQNVRTGDMEISGIDEYDDLQFRMTKAGERRVEKDLLPKLSTEDRIRFEDAAREIAERKNGDDPKDTH